jgi:hypothetical protein
MITNAMIRAWLTSAFSTKPEKGGYWVVTYEGERGIVAEHFTGCRDAMRAAKRIGDKMIFIANMAERA